MYKTVLIVDRFFYILKIFFLFLLVVLLTCLIKLKFLTFKVTQFFDLNIDIILSKQLVSNNYIIDYKIYYNKNILELPFDQFFNNNKNCFYIKEAYYNSNLIVSHTNHFGCLYRNSSYFEIFYDEFNIFNYLDYKPSILD